MKPPAILFSMEAGRHDPALRTRGDRKLLVTALYGASEEEATEADWQSATSSGKCPVQVMADTESALFNETAKQTRHCHKIATEIYVLLEGRMTVEVEGREHTLVPGDMMTVQPGAYHQIRRTGRFLCRVITVNCSGPKDRYE